MRTFLRGSATLALILAMTWAGRVPLCFSSACPMSAAERATCKAMGRECCQPRGSAVAHAPTLAGPLVAVAAPVVSAAGPALRPALASAELAGLVPYPALLHRIGLFTLLSAFLI